MDKKYGLSEDELAAFRKNGYIGPFDLYSPEEIGETYKKLRPQMFDREFAVYDLDHTSLLAGYDRHLDIDFFSQHIMQRRILDKLESILGPDILCWRSELFPKYPGDEGTDWHQADTFAHASGAPQIEWPSSEFGGAVTVWTAVTEANEENGCLRFIPGTQEEMFYDESKEMAYKPEEVNKLEKDGIKRGFFGYDYRNLQKDPSFVPDESAAASITMKAGQFVIFWSTLMHSSFPNTTTNKTRLGFTARYVPTCVKVYPDTDTVDEYGTVLSLEKYGTVLVSGEDDYQHNKILNSNTRGYVFASED
ncbi:chlorinating enzyme [Aliikangiella coralliicola]|uniref:Chlorinating enzyme n=1 Tax=Aliikangiella coralliicola TaxID=2592383 RepID=A0A545TV42_9GAMM|nr:chlorinating enzyme [Aliikangiella coralliicola]TQV81086.1 chlorinating enzyme [Aliikangiella coralliicola]